MRASFTDMADFSHLSDTDESSAVEELISQAEDLTILEQVSKINCSGFTDYVLPSDIETRFRKLKSFPVSNSIISAPRNSFPASKARPRSVSEDDEETEIFSGKVGSFKRGKQIFLDSKQFSEEKSAVDKESGGGHDSPPLKSFKSSTGEDRSSLSKEEYPKGKKGLRKKFEGGSISSPSDFSNSRTENVNSPIKPVSEDTIGPKSKSKDEILGSPFGLSQLSSDSYSPPRKAGCFWCSPKRVSKKKSSKNFSFDWGDKNAEFLSDLGTLSAKEQQKILRKAMKEEQKISREAEKIVKWAKQASARMGSPGIEDELSEDDFGK